MVRRVRTPEEGREVSDLANRFINAGKARGITQRQLDGTDNWQINLPCMRTDVGASYQRKDTQRDGEVYSRYSQQTACGSS